MDNSPERMWLSGVSIDFIAQMTELSRHEAAAWIVAHGASTPDEVATNDDVEYAAELYRSGKSIEDVAKKFRGRDGEFVMELLADAQEKLRDEEDTYVWLARMRWPYSVMTHLVGLSRSTIIRRFHSYGLDYSTARGVTETAEGAYTLGTLFALGRIDTRLRTVEVSIPSQYFNEFFPETLKSNYGGEYYRAGPGAVWRAYNPELVKDLLVAGMAPETNDISPVQVNYAQVFVEGYLDHKEVRVGNRTIIPGNYPTLYFIRDVLDIPEKPEPYGDEYALMVIR